MKNTSINLLKINNSLKKISENEIFSKSPRSIRLLNFLVQESIEGNHIKEQTIGLELFSKKYDPNKNDGKVRVYMYNLRKKLDQYYETDGKNDPLQFIINKGQYNIQFISSSALKKSKDSQKQKIIITAVSLATILWIAISIFSQTELYCWENFLKNNSETTCIISDHKILQGKLNSGEIVFIRNPKINTEKDLNKYLLDHKSTHYTIPNFTFVTKMAPVASKALTKLFNSHGKDFNIRLESEFSFENIRNQNIIFIGQYKTMSQMSALFLKNSKRFKVFNDSISYKSNDGIINYINKGYGNKKTDYVFVSFMPIDDGHEILFFSSNHDIGVIAAVNHFSDFNWLKDFYKSISTTEKYYNALFKVDGLGRTDLNFKLEQIEWIK